MNELKEEIRSGNFKKVYLFYGEEAFRIRQYRKLLLDAAAGGPDDMNFSRYEGKNIDIHELIGLCETLPFLSERRVILLENTGFFKNKCEELADYMKNLPSYLLLLFVEREVDKRNGMYKAVSKYGRAVDFETPKEDQLIQWIGSVLKKNGRRVTEKDAGLILALAGNDMMNLSNELEKLCTYTEGRDAVREADIRAVCTVRTENRIFDMIRSVTERNQKRALELYQDLLTLKEPPMRILYLMGRQFQQLLLTKKLLQEGASRQEILSLLKVPSYAFSRLSACAASYTEEELRKAVADCVQAEEDVKTGKLGDTLSVELFLISHSSRAAR